MMSNMKRLATVLVSACALLATCVQAEEGFLLISRGGERALVKADTSGFRDVVKLSGPTLYGDSATEVGLLSQSGATRGNFIVIDKPSGKVRASFPAAGQPASQLSGPSRDVVMSSEFAYFATIRFNATATATIPNVEGGIFDLHRLSLRDGAITDIPLPQRCVNPRVVSVGDAVFVYAWNGDSVWRVDTESARLEQIVSANDFDESVVSESARIPAQIVEDGAFSDFIVLPTGLFRISTQGTLQFLLREDFRRAGDHRTVNLKSRSEDRIVRVLGAPSQQSPAVGIIRDHGAGFVFSMMNPLTGAMQWTVQLSDTAVPDSFQLLEDGSVMFVDRATRSVVRASRSEKRDVWLLDALGSQVDNYNTRIVTVLTGR